MGRLRPVVEVDGVTKRFGDRTAVDGVSFTVEAGQTYGLLGPNGAGKTTTISMMCGLLDPDSGSVTISGHRLDEAERDAKRSIGYVPQDLALYPDLTGRENLQFFARLQGLKKHARRERVEACLHIVGLADRADDRVEDYSGGMKRRANIAAGLLHEPAVLVLDEPTVGVDPQSRNAILDAIDDLGQAGMSILYTTHYMEEAERLCDRIGVIDHGKLIAEGTRSELLALVGERTTITVETTGNVDLEPVRAAPGVERATQDGTTVLVVVEQAQVTLAPVVGAIGSTAGIVNVEIDQPDLESVFLHLTGRALRDP